jgi:hypothetical protein
MQLPSAHEPPPTPRNFLQRQSRDEKRDPSISSTGSSNKSRKMGLKNLRISSPVRSDDNDDREPLTPRFYNPPSPPSPPAQNDHRVRFEQPPTPQTGMSMESDSYASERLDQPKPLPSAQPQRRPANLNLSLPSNPSATKSGSPGANALPLRAFQNNSDVSLASSDPLSPGPMKTTYLERKPMNRGPLTARTPRTGVPQTPYSAYMPFTPMTPVTPGLVSRKERKERIKAEGRKVIDEEDFVKDKEDTWDM